MAEAVPTQGLDAKEPPPSNPPTQSDLREDDASELAAIHGYINRLRSFTGRDPYILTIPQDDPQYRHTYAFQARQWLDNSPFDRHEPETTQYQTFHYHEPGTTIYMPHSSRPLESDGPIESVRRERQDAAGRATPGDAPKKVMSLGAYKKKVAGQTPDVNEGRDCGEVKPNRLPTSGGPVKRIQADEEMLAAVEQPGEMLKIETDTEETRTGSVKDMKRKREMHGPSEDERTTKKIRSSPRREKHAGEQSPEPRSAGRPRSIPEPVREQSSSQHEIDATNKSREALPPRLSPLKDPPKDRQTHGDSSPREELRAPSSHKGVPSRLSPTLPSNIMTTLQSRAHIRSASRSSEVSGKLTPKRHLSPGKIAKHRSPVPRNGFRANSSSPAVRSDPEDHRGRSKLLVPVSTMHSSAGPPADSEDGETGISTATKRKASHLSRNSLIVVLKFTSARRKRLRKMIYGDGPSASKSSVEKAQAVPKAQDLKRRDRDIHGKGIAQRVGPTVKGESSTRNGMHSATSPKPSGPSAEPAAAAKGPISKQSKDSSDSGEHKNRQEITTPRKQTGLSSTSLMSSTQKSVSTPGSTVKKPPAVGGSRGDHLSASVPMKRDLSNASIASSVDTPVADSPSIPQQVQPNGLSAKQNPPSSQPKTARQQAWELEQRRLEALGKELKRAVEAHTKNSGRLEGNAQHRERELAAVKSIESLLAYFLAFTCCDQVALSAHPSQHPSTKWWRTLHGYFGFVKHNCEAFPSLLGLTCWLGVVFNAHILDLASQASLTSENRDVILEASRMMHRAAIEAEKLLDVDALMNDFPKSWTERSSGDAGLGKEPLEPGKFEGSYRLPLGVQSSPTVAARAAFSILEEWMSCSRKLAYSMKLKLHNAT